jgi:hypothetical protein
MRHHPSGVKVRCFCPGEEPAAACARRLRVWLCWIVCAGSWLVPVHSARAGEADRTFMERTRGNFELALSGRSDLMSSLWVASGVVSVDHAFSHGYGIGFDWGFFLAREAPTNAGTGRWATGPGNPWLKVWHEAALGPRTWLRVAAGATVPAAWLPPDATRRGILRDGYAFGAATRGLWNAWLWAPQQIALALAAKLLHDPTALWRIGLEGALAGSLSMGQFTRDAGAAYLQLAPLIELRGQLLAAGVRLQAVLSDARPDPLQLSAQAYVRFERPHWQLQAAGLCNLDEPLGVLGAGLSVCGALLALGVQP